MSTSSFIRLIVLSFLVALMPSIPMLHALNQNVLWFDFDGVLVTTDRMKALWHIGPTHLVGFFNPSLSRLEQSMFAILEEIQPYTATTPLLYSHYGNRIPALMIEYLLGNITSQAINEQLNARMPNIAERFDSGRKFNLIKAIINFTFTPHKMANAIVPIAEAVKLFHHCSEARYPDGNKKNRIFIITNYDKETFRFIAQNPLFADFFDLCDGIIVSGVVHLIKPEKAIFEYATHYSKAQLGAERIIYIDDRPENLAGAKAFDERIITIECKNFKFHPIKKKLKQLGVL